ncbi:MAG: septal ring factor EnvC (AmiA/AmiB activator) [Maribacter sp.]|jgi:septal ring factor EnvC (AmiA/AmiB activator)
MKKLNKLLLLIIFLLLPMLMIGQNRKQLEEKRKGLLKDIKVTDQMLKETKKNKNLTYERYITIQEQIKARNELVKTIQQEVGSYDLSLERTADVIISLDEDIEQLKKDYKNLLQIAYRRKLMKSDLLFLFSSQNFNDAFKRWQYLKQYDKHRKKQAKRILETQLSLEGKLDLQEERKEKKERLLASEKNHLLTLEQELKTKNRLLKELKSNEKTLRKKISKRKGEHENLNVTIENIIEKDLVGGRKKNRTVPDKPSKNSASSIDYSSSFQSGRGNLPWPVRGVISSYFGKQNHPTLKDIIINNSGIDILAMQSSRVKPIAAGEVAAVRFVPGNDYLVIIQHGTFYTLYSKLEEHYVKKGDKVSPSDEIGMVKTDSNTGKTELHFEVWRNQTRLNPRDWIYRH